MREQGIAHRSVFRSSQTDSSTGEAGYILPVVLFFFACTLLWGALFLLTLSDRYAAEHELLFREQSRLLAYSGWNLALQQLETEGDLQEIVLERPEGTARTTLQSVAENRVAVQATAEAGDCRSVVQGTVQLMRLPWAEVCRWTIADGPLSQEPGLLLATDGCYTLRESCAQPLAICAADGAPVEVCVDAPLSVDVLYVDGNLTLEAPLAANVIYLSGELRGAEQLLNPSAVRAYAGESGYRIEVLERVL